MELFCRIKPFKQLVTIQDYFFEKTYPLFYWLLSDKIEGSYSENIKKISNLKQFTPFVIINDFERFFINSVQNCFLYANSHGYFFIFLRLYGKEFKAVVLQSCINKMKFLRNR